MLSIHGVNALLRDVAFEGFAYIAKADFEEVKRRFGAIFAFETTGDHVRVTLKED